MKQLIILVFTILFITPLNLFSQYPPKKLSDSEIKTLAEKFDGENVLAHTLITTFEFDYNDKEGKITVKEKHNDYYLSLSGNEEKVVYFDFYDDFSSIEAPSGSKAESYTQKMKIDGIFHHDVYSYAYYFNIDLPNRIYNVSYLKKHFDSRYLTSVYFQTVYPVLNRILIFYIPDNIKIELKEINFEGFEVRKKVEEKNGEKIITYELNELDAFPEVNNAPGRSFYAPHILVLSKEVVGKEDQSDAIILRNTQDQYNWYIGLVENAENDPTNLKLKVTDITDGLTDDKEKVQAIFLWVQENIKYIAYEDGISGFQPESCQDVYYNRYGDCKGMANLMTEMLRSIDIDARMTWIGTNSIAYDYSIPSLAVDNHAICTVLLDGNYYFLDATEKYIGLDDYAERIQGRPALIENEDTYLIKKIPTYSYDRNLNKTEMIFEMNDGVLYGTINADYNGESSVRIMREYNSIYDDYKDKAINYLIISDDNNIHVDEIKGENFNKIGETIHLKSKVHIENKISKFADYLYLDWDIYKEFNDLEIDSNRTVDFVLSRKIYEINTTHFKTPSNYKINSYPEDLVVESDEFILRLEFDYSESNQSLKITKEIIITNGKISKQNFKTWNNTITTLKEDYYETPIIYEEK
jgi:hypothetical protein